MVESKPDCNIVVIMILLVLSIVVVGPSTGCKDRKYLVTTANPLQDRIWRGRWENLLPSHPKS